MADEQKYLELPALGLPFALGTLYNANKNQIVPGITLCEYEDTDTRSANIVEHSNITCKTDMTTSVSLESKMNSLGIKGNFKISALANKVVVSGSGGYLSDKKTSKTEAMVVLESSGTKRDEFLIMNRFLKENFDFHQELISKTEATHVVAGITYGHQFFLTLKKKCESEEEKLDVEANIQLNVTLGNVEVLINANDEKKENKVSYNTTNVNKINKLQVNIHGNVEIPINPTSFKEAMDIYKTLPDLVKDKDSPMTVYLLPLASICSSVPKVCSPIKEDVLSSVTAIFEDISYSEVALSGIQTSDVATWEPRLLRRAKLMSAMLNRHKIWLQMKLHQIICDHEMDNDFTESEQILNVLQKHNNSPFSATMLGICVSQLEKEVHFIKNLVGIFEFSHADGRGNDRKDRKAGRNTINIDICSDETDFAIPFDNSNVFVLEIPIIREEDDLLKEIENYDPDNDQIYTRLQAEPLILPFKDEDTQMEILKCAKTFIHLADSKKGDNDKHGAKFRCMFKGFEREEKPKIIKFDALIGEKEIFDIDKYINTEMKRSA